MPKSTTKPKKTTAKAKAKKSPVKKVVQKKPSKITKAKVLVCASDQECFWTNDGTVLKDLSELKDALAYMSSEIFAHHVTKDKNDFADWVENVLEDTECAADLRKRRTPATARTVVIKHLRVYNI